MTLPLEAPTTAGRSRCFCTSLNSAEKSELKVRADFKSLQAATTAEPDAGRQRQAQLEEDDTQFRGKRAQAYEEMTDVAMQMKLGGTGCANLTKRCGEMEAESEARMTNGLEAISAVPGAIMYHNSYGESYVFDTMANIPHGFLDEPELGE